MFVCFWWDFAAWVGSRLFGEVILDRVVGHSKTGTGWKERTKVKTVCGWGIMNRCLLVTTRELETNRRNCSALLQLPEPEFIGVTYRRNVGGSNAAVSPKGLPGAPHTVCLQSGEGGERGF